VLFFRVFRFFFLFVFRPLGIEHAFLFFRFLLRNSRPNFPDSLERLARLRAGVVELTRLLGSWWGRGDKRGREEEGEEKEREVRERFDERCWKGRSSRKATNIFSHGPMRYLSASSLQQQPLQHVAVTSSDQSAPGKRIKAVPKSTTKLAPEGLFNCFAPSFNLRAPTSTSAACPRFQSSLSSSSLPHASPAQ